MMKKEGLACIMRGARIAIAITRKLGSNYKFIIVFFVAIIWFFPFFLGNSTIHQAIYRDIQTRLNKSNVFIKEQDTLQAPDNTYKDRRNIMLEACKGHEDKYVGNNSEVIVENHLVVDRKHKIVYCGIEKVGSTFWRRVFQIFVGASKAKSPFEIPPAHALGGNVEIFSKITFDDAHDILQSSWKFMFVRNPYSRLFSGYIDKLLSPNPYFWQSIGTYVIKLLRKNASVLSLKCGHDVSFPEFVKYFIHSETNNRHRDGHFIPMFDHCRPCRIKYDFIGKMENFKEDSLYILHKFEFTDIYKSLENFDNLTLHDTMNDEINNVFSFSPRLKNCISIHEAFKRVWQKLQIRGFLGKEVKFPFTEVGSKKLSKTKLLQFLITKITTQNNKSSLRANKKQAMIDAYKSLDREDLRRLSEIFQPDCELFNYDCNPKYLFEQVPNRLRLK